MTTLHGRKIEGYTAIGYEVITDDGHNATLAYVPYSQKFIKLAEIEDGKVTSCIALSAKELQSLYKRVGLQTESRSKKNIHQNQGG
ncbi:hypothetical protein HNR77_002515 [Paenibacillus sp. JGP012]|uniref:hypothetical protein n=1 Tax=Paenibacillus sp. JGP012 TaxID=2735914 RepID=UPI00161B370B|nr:hypothetical protein [Paenibacillus sp. JGP012]MBB6021420.1 hypothetical protein [Paenibacillus sp. JGP012]